MNSSVNSPVTSIEDLPPEMLCELFKHLGLRNLVVCSMVNKRWHSAYSSYRLHQLAVIEFTCNSPSYFPLDRWFNSLRKFEYRDLCHPEAFSRLMDKPLFSNLKHLALSGFANKKYRLIDPNKLNVLVNLEHLELQIDLGENVNLTLPRLRLLAIHSRDSVSVNMSTCRISIDCPKLNTLLYHDTPMNLLEVKHPETIRKLDTNMSDAKLAMFRNVECLITQRFGLLSRRTLLSLPGLKELHHGKMLCPFFSLIDRHRQKVNLLKEFLNHLETLRGSDLKFTLAGLPLTKATLKSVDFSLQLNRFGTEVCYNERHYLKNCHLFDPEALVIKRQIYYNHLMESVDKLEIPAAFFQNITGILSVEIDDEIKSESHLLWFLKSLNSLEQLTVEGLKLSQKFYDQLPESVRLPLKIRICECDYDDDLELNFDFIERLPRWSEICLSNVNLSFASLASLFRSVSRLEPGSINYQLIAISSKNEKHRNLKRMV